MRVVVFGATGEIGARLVSVLTGRGVDVVAAQRSCGVDAYTGAGLGGICDGADAVVDVTNIATPKSSVAVDFFGAVANHIASAARAAGVRRVVCLSIINAAEATTNAKLGYYQGKAHQERVYREQVPPERLTIVRSAQWYELAEEMLGRIRLGPLAVVPHMMSRPLAAADAATMLADAVTSVDGCDVEIAGPAELDLVDVAKAVARQSGSPRWVVGVKVGGSALRRGGLLPRGDFERAPTTLDRWLADRD